MFRLSDGEEIMTLAFFVLIQYRSVTDGRTYIPPLAIPAVCIARYANALVKMLSQRNCAMLHISRKLADVLTRKIPKDVKLSRCRPTHVLYRQYIVYYLAVVLFFFI